MVLISPFEQGDLDFRYLKLFCSKISPHIRPHKIAPNTLKYHILLKGCNVNVSVIWFISQQLQKNSLAIEADLLTTVLI